MESNGDGVRRGEKLLIAIPFCHQYHYSFLANHLHNDRQGCRIDALRATWLQDVADFPNVEYRIFYGRGAGREALSDEVFLDCDDSYVGLPQKVRLICCWALDHGFSWLYKCDDDTFCFVDRLLSGEFEKHDQVGFKLPGEHTYIVGGPGYTLSTPAMMAVSRDTVTGHAEDLWVGSTLRKYGLDRHRDLRFLSGLSNHYIDVDRLPANHNYIGLHAVTKEGMLKLHAENPVSR